MRRRLRQQKRMREALLLDLGALVYELHRHGRREPELLQAKAAELTAVDQEVRGLAEALEVDDSVLTLVAAGIAGSCENCGSLLSTDARYCGACGVPAVAAVGGSLAPPTAALDGPAAREATIRVWKQVRQEPEAPEPEPEAAKPEAEAPEPNPEAAQPEAEPAEPPEPPELEPEPEAAQPEPQPAEAKPPAEEPEAAQPDPQPPAPGDAEPEPIAPWLARPKPPEEDRPDG